ncbi:MAG: hypothetical protein Q4C50_04510 [Eubacteriales bacterium]|nr:hypothetical protein [Eubacteriales bacterium]
MRKQIFSYIVACAAAFCLTFSGAASGIAGAAQDTSDTTGDTSGAAQGASNASGDTYSAAKGASAAQAVKLDMPDGEYSIEVDLAGGSGKASVVSPTILTVQEGKAYARIEWSSANYDYMIVASQKYLNASAEGGNSVFDIPVTAMDEGMSVIADTTAMGTPHEINYTLTFYSETIGAKSQMPREAAKRVVAVALAIIIGGGILNHFVNKRRDI